MPDEPQPLVIKGLTPTKISGRGRPKGAGCNLRLLLKLKPGVSIWEVPEKKMRSIRESAARAGIRIKVRRQPESDKYAIWRVE